MEEAAQIWIMVAAIAGGLLGARLANITLWKGALMIVVGLIVVVAVHIVAKTDSELLLFAVAVIAMGITGGGLRLSGRATGSVVICGSVLGAIAMAVAGSH